MCCTWFFMIFFQFQFINGGDIDQLVQKKVFLPWSVRVHLACDVSKGLRYLHSLGIFHRDLTAKVGVARCFVAIFSEYHARSSEHQLNLSLLFFFDRLLLHAARKFRW